MGCFDASFEQERQFIPNEMSGFFSDSDGYDTDTPPALDDRNDSSSDDDSSSDGSENMPSLIENAGNDSSDSDSDDDSDDMPHLIDRNANYGSDSSYSESDSDSSSLPSLQSARRGGRRSNDVTRGKGSAETRRSNVQRVQSDDDLDDMPPLMLNTYMRKDYASSLITKLFLGLAARRQFVRVRRGFTLMQAISRGMITRILHKNVFRHIQEYRIFCKQWRPCLKIVSGVIRDEADWAALRDKQAYIRRQELVDEDMQEADDRLTEAATDAMRMEDDESEYFDAEEEGGEEETGDDEKKLSNEDDGMDSAHSSDDSSEITFTKPVKRIHFSTDVVKWLKQGDKKYKDFFIRRMKQLARGERSRILNKRLSGCVSTIYETYLEQKSGFRIMWTEKDDYLLVWYVAKHKSVSRLAGLIDDAKHRSERQRVYISEVEGMKDIGRGVEKKEHQVFLDPLGNVPLKVYDINAADIDQIAEDNWTPGLYLTDEERDVVETKGTILLLGRSGTGKTVCICNRMEFDRQKYAKEKCFSQLFVARSPRLCKYVEKNIGATKRTTFTTYENVLNELENELPDVDSVRNIFPKKNFMNFAKFKREVYKGDEELDALVVWTNIRSFVKGSIEALQNSPCVLTESDYLSQQKFGKKRCRLSNAQRKIVFKVFEKYQTFMKESGAWDNCDRIISLIQRLQAAKVSHPEKFQGGKTMCKWSKIYVDEVQDYTQAECLLFFYLSGAGNLFLAGDPAQNVVKGVEFRFEDIRSVGYHIAGNSRHLIPQKPKVVNVNFRSHAGILDAASAILSQMFAVFPDSAKQLGKDDGLFQGPRPGVFHKAKSETIGRLLAEKMQGAVILTHDDNVNDCKEKLGGYELVYGIRAAKGLEFKTVIVLDFFSALPISLQRPWREMLLKRASDTFKLQHPEVEGQLKLLYTAVTRCIDRLFFAETAASISGDAFVRWMTTKTVKGTDAVSKSKDIRDTKTIATLNNIRDIENMTETQDGWVALGFENAEAAEIEGKTNRENAQSLIGQAIYCFEQAKNEAFARKAKIQLESFQFRNIVESSNEDDDRLKIETEGAQIMAQLLRENLLLEASRLGKDMELLLDGIYSSSPFFRKWLLNELPTVTDDSL